MAILPGPVKLDLIFDEPNADEPPWRPTPDNLAAIDAHFWDWMLWLLGKRVHGRSELVTAELQKMFDHLLSPLGVEMQPASLDDAVASYVVARGRLEQDLAVTVPRTLEREVTRILDTNRESQ